MASEYTKDGHLFESDKTETLSMIIYLYILETINSHWYLQLQFSTFYSSLPAFHICTFLLHLPLSSFYY